MQYLVHTVQLVQWDPLEIYKMLSAYAKMDITMQQEMLSVKVYL